ncbi:SDR family oxidoreductase [Sulfodiicoccus acidiphilus]|nr:NAD(P)-dependent oxidoreductase [Sulfodiicoccus acidiphilus]
MRALVLGGSGQLGLELREVLSNYEVVWTYSSREVPGGVKLDVRDFNSLEDLVLRTRPDVVVNAAAFTDVDGCETDRERCLKVNGEAVKHLVRAARVVEAYVVHVSTDYVFDGERGNYAEEDVPNPVNYYGLSKLVGEAYALSYDDSLVVRTSGVFRHKGYVPYALRALREGREVAAFRGYYSPISARKLAQAVHELVGQRRTGVLNVAGERVSRYDLAVKLKEMYGLPGKVREVQDVQGWKARRPFDSSLNSSRARGLISVELGLEENLEDLLKVEEVR